MNLTKDWKIDFDIVQWSEKGLWISVWPRTKRVHVGMPKKSIQGIAIFSLVLLQISRLFWWLEWVEKEGAIMLIHLSENYVVSINYSKNSTRSKLFQGPHIGAKGILEYYLYFFAPKIPQGFSPKI